MTAEKNEDSGINKDSTTEYLVNMTLSTVRAKILKCKLNL